MSTNGNKTNGNATIQFVVHSKKTGKDYVFTTATVFAAPQDLYSWRKGTREYLDNYTSELVWKRRDGTTGVNPVTKKVWTNRVEYDAMVASWNDEAHKRWHDGDTAGERTPSDPNVVKARVVATKLIAAGIVDMDDDELAMIQKHRAGKAAKLAARK